MAISNKITSRSVKSSAQFQDTQPNSGLVASTKKREKVKTPADTKKEGAELSKNQMPKQDTSVDRKKGRQVDSKGRFR